MGDRQGRGRGTLRVYLGAAPGVGKTYAMLDEGHRRLGRGTDVVVGFVESHGRPKTEQLVEGFEIVPRQRVSYRGTSFEDMDLDAVIARHPKVALVDELAHTNVPGLRHEKRWQDVDELLDHGIDVVTTVNIQHLESLNDLVDSITGVSQAETVPDEVVRRADQIELVDMSPEALRRRLAHGNVYTAEKVDAALSNYFRVGNLTALRELALLWTADRVDAALDRYRAEHDITAPWPARERVVVAVTGGPESATLVRRGARIAQRSSGGELLVVHVSRGDGLAGVAPDALARQRILTESLDGSWHSVLGDDTAQAILEFARGVNASHIVLGASSRSRWSSAFFPGVGPAVVRESGDIDVTIVTHSRAGTGTRAQSTPSVLGPSRLAVGWALAVLGPLLLAAGLVAVQDLTRLSTVLMLFLVLTIVVARVGGLWPALLAAVASGVLSNFFFTPPVHTWTIAQPEDGLAIVILIGVAISVSTVVHSAAQQRLLAVRARAEADTLTVVAGSVLRGASALPTLLGQLRETFALEGVSLLERPEGERVWSRLGGSGTSAPSDPARADTTVPVREGLVLCLEGRALSAEQLRVVNAVALQAEAAVERDRLSAQAEAAELERRRTETGTALLAAVSHDLRTPLAAITAAVSAMLARDATLEPSDQDALLHDIRDSAERLQGLVDNLLDMSRIGTGAVRPVMERMAVDGLILAGLADLTTDRIDVDVPDDLPLVAGDAGLLERVVANVAENALRHTPADTRVAVSASKLADTVVVRVIDHGPGIPDDEKRDMFLPFQRSGDVPRGHGLGLGLAVAHGLAQANGATLEAEDTPGGGLTMILTLPIARGAA